MEFADGSRMDGYIPLILRERYADFGLPTTFDTGAWDAWFSFEMERRGAQVTAVDAVDVPNFHHADARHASKSPTLSRISTIFPATIWGQFVPALCRSAG